MFHAIVLWLHILAAVAFIGPQIFLVVAAMPALRTIADVKARAAATRVMTMRFGVLGVVALVVLIVTGIMNYTYANSRHDLDAKRYFIALQIKLTLVLVVVVLTVLHGAVLGARLQRLQESDAPEEEIARTRQWSMWLSMANLAAGIVILLCAAVLGSAWSTQGSLR
jgi:copper resistance protein D